MDTTKPETVYEGRFLRVAKRGSWEYATRAKATGVVCVVAMHDDGRVVLIEQHRPPMDGSVIELPAGLAGDVDDTESLLSAARRELEEETGYTAEAWFRLPTVCTSPGLTDEAMTFFLARGLRRTGSGGGVGSESIRVHEVPLDEVPAWLEAAAAKGRHTAGTLLAGLYAASVHTQRDTG
ncbi:MAG: NUDIX hydrolase [Planctomycetota bacterium]